MPQTRRVRRVIRKVDTWSVLRLSLCFYLVLILVFVVAGAVLFLVATATGVRGEIEKFVGQLVGSGDDAHLSGGPILKAAALGGAVLVLSGTITNTLLVLLYNLISDVVGGVEVSVLEVDVNQPAEREKRQPAEREKRQRAERGKRQPAERDMRSPGTPARVRSKPGVPREQPLEHPPAGL